MPTNSESASSENNDENTGGGEGEKFRRTRSVLRAVVAVFLGILGLGAVSAIDSSPLAGLIALACFGLAIALVIRRTRGRVIDAAGRDIGTVALVGIVIILVATGAAALPDTDSDSTAPDQAASVADGGDSTTPTPAAAQASQPTVTASAAASEPTTATPTLTPTVTPTPTATPTPTPTPTATPASEPNIQVRILYSGEWSGAVGTMDSTRSIQGNGATTIDVPDDATTVSVNAQKQTTGGEELTVQILEGGEVVKEASTTADYGVAQVVHSFGFF